ncbi:MFS transporter [Rhodovibrio salinarum]|uniref:MFS transporter n=1 Tax=Rhodovibrio salinarum TaxID=1087 RepID=A0A934UZU0_9PROT|nr:MFS transporter [Rhodovibrio salinarum]MBK1696745.1 MFS transporter [Rhodovibrio salinarum]
MSKPSDASSPVAVPRRARVIAAWCLYDWASNAWPTVVSSFVFAAYVTREVAPNAEVGTAWWGTATAIAGIVVALLSPLLGAIADRAGRRKPWVGVFTAMTVLVSALLWTIAPEADLLVRAGVLIALGTATFEMSQVFYNAMLRDIAPAGKLGRVSGWAWALGYAGGLACLTSCLVLLVFPEPPLFGLDAGDSEPVRASALVVSAWFAVFSVPFFLLVPDRPASGLSLRAAARAGLAQLVTSLRRIWPDHREIAHYLIARMIYTDGLNTLFTFGGVYAAGTFGMGFRDILIFGIVLNVAAGLGALAFAWVDDWIGPKRTIQISLIGLLGFGVAALTVQSVTALYIAGCGLGLFIGPAQSASRSMMARMAPAHLQTEMFGLYALSGKATAFIGPALVGWITLWAGSQRAGMLTILAFFVVGFALLWRVPAPRGEAA